MVCFSLGYMDNYSGTQNLGEVERGRSSSSSSSSNLLCGLVTEQHRLRVPGLGGMMLVSSTSPGMQRCRAGSEMEVGVELDDYRSGRIGGPTKIGRTDGYAPFVCREQKMQIQMDSASAIGSGASASDHHLPVLRNRSGSDNSSACLLSEGRPRLAPSYASSERSILNNDGSSTVSSDSKLLRSNDPVLSATTTTTDARPSLLRAFYTPPPAGNLSVCRLKFHNNAFTPRPYGIAGKGTPFDVQMVACVCSQTLRRKIFGVDTFNFTHAPLSFITPAPPANWFCSHA